ncbi:MAG TPA: FadR/GntR family transcriptional regulator [Longimicrobiaceae bacterium]|jgi:GntR family transcriptional repressor for pyruvate dehydrogenase complex|nr:FadR/GntR family transcriptional regulator [Longimicrobiaceae bacterium]
MTHALTPVTRQSLPDDLAKRVRELIRSGGLAPGDRLPSIAEMARRFGVGHPTLREALKKLETLGIIDIRHGSGVYVGTDTDSLVISNPIFSGSATRKLLLDLLEARIPVEVTSVELAAKNASADHIRAMKSLLKRASENLDEDPVLSVVNMGFHREIASASGNAVLVQILDVLTNVFRDEQRLIMDIYGSRKKDHEQHLGILEALEAKDTGLAMERMRAHLGGVRDVILRWDSEGNGGKG